MSDESSGVRIELWLVAARFRSYADRYRESNQNEPPNSVTLDVVTKLEVVTKLLIRLTNC